MSLQDCFGSQWIAILFMSLAHRPCPSQPRPCELHVRLKVRRALLVSRMARPKSRLSMSFLQIFLRQKCGGGASSLVLLEAFKPYAAMQLPPDPTRRGGPGKGVERWNWLGAVCCVGGVGLRAFGSRRVLARLKALGSWKGLRSCERSRSVLQPYLFLLVLLDFFLPRSCPWSAPLAKRWSTRATSRVGSLALGLQPHRWM